jgi:hypothetical protein
MVVVDGLVARIEIVDDEVVEILIEVEDFAEEVTAAATLEDRSAGMDVVFEELSTVTAELLEDSGSLEVDTTVVRNEDVAAVVELSPASDVLGRFGVDAA